MPIMTSEFVKHHGQAFAFYTQGLTEDGCCGECGLDWLHEWFFEKGPEQVAALHTALIATEGRDRNTFDMPELAEITRAEAAALCASLPEGYRLKPHQAVTIRAMREH